jgi:hypothetical protein
VAAEHLRMVVELLLALLSAIAIIAMTATS